METAILIIVVCVLIVSLFSLWILCSFKDKQIKKLEEKLTRELEIRNVINSYLGGNKNAIHEYLIRTLKDDDETFKLKLELEKLLSMKEDDNGTDF